jgi:hypothetical protein
MDRLRYSIESTLQYDNRVDMQRSLDCYVFEHRQHLHGAYPSAVGSNGAVARARRRQISWTLTTVQLRHSC